MRETETQLKLTQGELEMLQSSSVSLKDKNKELHEKIEALETKNKELKERANRAEKDKE